jgi:hypothetical protein
MQVRIGGRKELLETAAEEKQRTVFVLARQKRPAIIIYIFTRHRKKRQLPSIYAVLEARFKLPCMFNRRSGSRACFFTLLGDASAVIYPSTRRCVVLVVTCSKV